MAGGEVPLGISADYTSDDAELIDIVEEVITARLLARLDLRTPSEWGRLGRSRSQNETSKQPGRVSMVSPAR